MFIALPLAAAPPSRDEGLAVVAAVEVRVSTVAVTACCCCCRCCCCCCFEVGGPIERCSSPANTGGVVVALSGVVIDIEGCVVSAVRLLLIFASTVPATVGTRGFTGGRLDDIAAVGSLASLPARWFAEGHLCQAEPDSKPATETPPSILWQKRGS